MLKIDQTDILFLKEQIIKRYNQWCIENQNKEKVLKLNTYLESYTSLKKSFDEIVGEGCIQTNSLRKLMIEDNEYGTLNFRKSTLDTFYKYFSGKTMDEYQTGKLSNKLRIKIADQFNTEFEFWRDVDKNFFMEQSLLKKVITVVDLTSLNDKQMAFIVFNAVHYADRSFKQLTALTKDNTAALEALYHLAMTGGIREKWRAEYVISSMNPRILLPFLYTREKVKESDNEELLICSIRDKKLIPALQNIIEKNPVLKEYALQVLDQINQ